MHLRHSYRPPDRLLAPDADGVWQVGPLSSRVQAAPGVAIYLFGANVYYANAGRLSEELLAIAAADPGVKRIVLDAGAISDIDYTGTKELETVRAELAEHGVLLGITRMQDDVRRQLRGDGLLERLGDEVYETLDDVVSR